MLSPSTSTTPSIRSSPTVCSCRDPTPFSSGSRTSWQEERASRITDPSRWTHCLFRTFHPATGSTPSAPEPARLNSFFPRPVSFSLSVLAWYDLGPVSFSLHQRPPWELKMNGVKVKNLFLLHRKLLNVQTFLLSKTVQMKRSEKVKTLCFKGSDHKNMSHLTMFCCLSDFSKDCEQWCH